jgi:hypothetical protein
MKLPKKSNIVVLVILFSIMFIWWSNKQKNDFQNDFNCNTVKMQLKSKITKVSGRTGYLMIHVDNNEKQIAFNFQSEISKKGTSKYHTFAEGDSIFKDENSKIVIVKSNRGITSFILDCDD